MSYFSYLAVDGTGKRFEGALEAEDSTAAHQDLSAKGLYVLKVRQTSNLLGGLGKKLRARNVKRTDVIDLSKNLSVMLAAGVQILTALDDIIATTENKTLHNVLTIIKKDIEMGSPFSDAVERHGDFFPDIFIRLVRVGEETGRFEKSLADIADHLQNIENLASAIKRALIYPSFAIVTTFGALIFWLIFVLPKITVTMKAMGVKLPFVTRALMAASEYTQNYWYLLPGIPMAVVLSGYFLKRKSTTRYYLDLLALKLPVVKLIVYNKLVALFAEQMRILVVAGLTIDRSFDLIAAAIGNEVFRRAIIKTKDLVTYGRPISEALKEQQLFPMLVIRMVNIGENSGTLDTQFGYLAEHYQKKLDDISDSLGKIIEPVVIATVGALFALIMVGLMLPVYDLVSSMGKG